MARSQMVFWCDRVMYFCFLPIAFFLPISSAVLEIFASIIFVTYLFKRIVLFTMALKETEIIPSVRVVGGVFLKTFAPGAHPLVWPVGIFFYATFLSVIASQFPYLSWKGFLGKTLESIVLFFAVTECFITRRRINIFLELFSLSAVFISIDGIWQIFFKKDFIFGHAFTSDGRVSSCFSHPNDFAGYLIIPLALFIAVLSWVWSTLWGRFLQFKFLFYRLLRLLFVFSGIIIVAFALGLTFSRGAWIGFAASMIVMICMDRKRWGVYFVFCLIFFSVFASFIGPIRNVSFVTDDISMDGRNRLKRLAAEDPKIKKSALGCSTEEIFFLLGKFNGAGRYVFWAETFNIVAAAPLFGTGLNTFCEAAPRFNKKWSGYYSHNCYLQMLAELGIVGLGAFLFVVFVLVKVSLESLKGSPGDFYWFVIVGLFAGWIGFLVHSALDTNFYSTRLANLMWIIMGVIVSVILLHQKDQA